MIVQHLRKLQEEYGYLPDEELIQLSASLKIPLARIQEVASFFPHFRQSWEPPPYVEVKVCRDMSCHLAGAESLIDRLKERYPTVDAARRIVIEGMSCVGRCDRAPAVCVSRYAAEGDPPRYQAELHDRYYLSRLPREIEEIVRRVILGGPAPGDDTDARNPGLNLTDVEIDIYADAPRESRYQAARELGRAIVAWKKRESDRIAEGKPGQPEKPPEEEWLERLKIATLLGMGGGGAPAAKKWADVRAQTDPVRYVIANGDESEPGTFKDRELMLKYPHLIVEGMILAALISGAWAGYVYVRHEYHEQIEALRKEITFAERIGALGDDVFGTGRAFRLKVYVSPGGYICGEQGALMEAIEDKRGQPRNKPPEPATNGLRQHPTVFNNVETFAWAPGIMSKGSDWYAKQIGFPNANGRRLFSISGDVESPGVFEMESGRTLRELIVRAGGVKGVLKAIATSGPSGGFWPARVPITLPIPEVRKRLEGTIRGVTHAWTKARLKEFGEKHFVDGATDFDLLDLPLDLDVFRALPPVLQIPTLILGAGLVVYNDSRDMLDQAINCSRFFRNESCGKCVPCRIGSQKLVEIGTDFAVKRGGPPDLALGGLVRELATIMIGTSICSLGHSAPAPLLTAMTFFPDDVTGGA